MTLANAFILVKVSSGDFLEKNYVVWHISVNHAAMTLGLLDYEKDAQLWLN